jgi:formylglycine-generating enzyme required for sulfatase activity
MGCNEALDTCLANETPQHRVILSVYAIDRTEVTATEYQACVDAGACSEPSDTTAFTSTYGNNNPLPINYVSREHASSYCGWSGKPAVAQALCTEAQWERAARGGCETIDGLVAKGLTNQEAGRCLGVSANTIKGALKRVLAKLDVDSRAEMASRLQRAGWV